MGVHLPVGSHVCLPCEPQVVVHTRCVPGVHSAQPSSMRPSQLSSRPLPQISAGGVQVGVHLPRASQVCLPWEPQVVVHGRCAPGVHSAQPLSTTPSQSSSTPLPQSSWGGSQPEV